MLSPRLHWRRAPGRELARLAWPIAISMLSYSAMTLVDTIFVGQLGAPILAGVGLAGTLCFALICFPRGLVRGLKVLVAQARGAGDPSQELAYLGAALVISVWLGAVVIAIGTRFSPLLTLLTESAAAGEAASGYLSVRVFSMPAVLVFIALRELRYGRSDARTPMIATVVGNVTNIVLDYVFIVVLDLGAPGAAWATVIAQTLECSILVVLQLREGFGLRHTSARHIRDLLSIGAPTGAQALLEVGAFAIVTVMLAGHSDREMAAHQITLQLIHVSLLPCVAVGEAAGVLTGQAVGARRLTLVRVVALRGAVLTTTWAAIATVLALWFRHDLVRLFADDPALQASAAGLLVIASVFHVFDALLVVAFGALRGVGDVRFPAMLGVGCSWLVTPPLTFFLGLTLDWGARGAWLGLCLEIIFLAAALWMRLLAPCRGGRLQERGWVLVARRQRAVVVKT